jgi:predicted nucleic-acid-binding Zn-ribbon protein
MIAMASARIVRMVSTHTNKECKMCKDTKLGHRWEYKNYQYIPSHAPDILLVCQKCIYREIYGSKQVKKAIKQKLLHKLNYNFGNIVPNLEK